MGYRRFLHAHASVLAPIERAVGLASLWNGWAPRLHLLRSDLEALGESLPAVSVPPVGASEAELWGMLYVVEGSRLGGAVLAARVGGEMPRRYLAEKPAPGHWRLFLAALEEVGEAGSLAWRAEVVQGAHRGFALFGEAARTGLDRAYAVA
jgi:heme oxygenase